MIRDCARQCQLPHNSKDYILTQNTNWQLDYNSEDFITQNPHWLRHWGWLLTVSHMDRVKWMDSYWHTLPLSVTLFYVTLFHTHPSQPVLNVSFVPVKDLYSHTHGHLHARINNSSEWHRWELLHTVTRSDATYNTTLSLWLELRIAKALVYFRWQ